ncbi:MAG: glutamate racemase [Defluviitaleaceae bacterium]|nr:glutamate racemase [Defluviitaleaceae bacterium]
MIGVFDSGVGGLTVVQEIRKIMPTQDIIYFGDTARAPYGGKDTETLISHGREIISFFVSKGVKAVVMACGTSSSTSFEQLKREFDGLPIIDTIRPAVLATCELAAQKDIKPVFIATSATIKSGLFARLLAQKLPDIKLYTRACPLFAPMAEAGLGNNNPLVTFAAENYLADLKGKVNALILGCTHYPLFTDALGEVLGDIIFINPAVATARAAKEQLGARQCTEGDKAIIEYYTSGEPEGFGDLARVILGEGCSVEQWKNLGGGTSQ